VEEEVEYEINFYVYYAGTVGAVITSLLPSRRSLAVATLYSHPPVKYHLNVHHSMLVSFSHTHYSTSNMQIHTYNAEDVFELLNYHDQAFMLDHISEQKGSTLEAEELQPKPKARTMTEFPEGLGLAEAGIVVFRRQ